MRNFAIKIANILALFDIANFTNFSILMMSTQGTKAHWRLREGERDYV